MLLSMSEQRRNLLFTVTSFLMITSFEIGVNGQCSTPPINQAVWEGTPNTFLTCSSPTKVAWTFKPTTDEFATYTLTNYTDIVAPTYTSLFDVNSTGLNVKNAQTSGVAPPIATSGVYIIRINASDTQYAAKLVVVSVGPSCTCKALNSSNIQLNCSLTYADSQIVPINAKMTWTADGNFYKTDTPVRTKPNSKEYISSSVQTVSGYYPPSYRGAVTFAQPTGNMQPDLASNAPAFSASCTVPYCGLTTTRKPATTSRTTARPTTITSPAPAGLPSTTLPPVTAASSSTTVGQTTAVSPTTTTQPTTSSKSIITTTKQLITTTKPPTTATSLTTATSDKLLAITTAFPISVDPLFGPIAGGTHITIIGSTSIGYFAKYFGSDITGVRNVYIGKDLSSTSVLLLPTESSTFEVVAVTPNTTEASMRQPLPIIIEFSPTSINMSFNKFFVYLPNPEITGIYPNSFLVTGGTLIDVFGQSFSSVAKPIIQLTVVITRSDQNSPTSNTTTRICTVPPGNDTYMQCPMPPLTLPEDFLEILNLRFNTNVTRRRRSRDSRNYVIANSRSFLSRMKRDVNVLTVNASNGIDRAEIYLGFILDGYREYENFNDAFPETKLLFYSAPEINSSGELIEFDPSEEELIYVKGRYMMRGCRLIDYLVHIGNQTCTISDLQDNQLSCRPPKVEPSPTVNDTIYCHQHLRISITVGYRKYQYACLKYADHSWRLALIIGLTVGLAAFAILLAILVTVCIAKRRKSKVIEETDRLEHTRGVELRYNRHKQNAERPGSRQDPYIVHKRQIPMTIYRPDYDHEIALQPESQHDYDHRIQEYDGDIRVKPNSNYLTSNDGKLNCDW